MDIQLLIYTFVLTIVWSLVTVFVNSLLVYLFQPTFYKGSKVEYIDSISILYNMLANKPDTYLPAWLTYISVDMTHKDWRVTTHRLITLIEELYK